MKKNALVVVGSVLFSLTALAAGPLNLNVNEGSVKFLAVGKPSAIRIRGTGESPKGSITVKDTEVKGEFEVALASLDTGISLRTNHMKEKYLEVQKFPNAIFSITQMKLPAAITPDGYSADDVPVTGLLTLRGVQHAVSGKASVRSDDGKVTANVQFPVSLAAHGISIPVYLGITVTDQVEVEVEVATKL